MLRYIVTVGLKHYINTVVTRLFEKDLIRNGITNIIMDPVSKHVISFVPHLKHVTNIPVHTTFKRNNLCYVKYLTFHDFLLLIFSKF